MELASDISKVGKNHLVYRGVAVEALMKGASFTAVIHLLLRGGWPAADEESLLNAVLICFADHGTMAPCTLASRVSASCGAGMAAALIAGLACAGEHHMPVGAAVDWLRGAGGAARRIPGLGHPLHTDDPRVKALFAMRPPGPHRWRLLEAQAELAAKGRMLPVNPAGAIAAVLLDAGWAREQIVAVALLSRLAGLAAHAAEQADTGQVCIHPVVTFVGEGARP
jgi:citrate synthase